MLRARTGAIGLKGYLESIRIAPTMRCSCGAVETVKHMVLSCPLYNDLRDRIWGEEKPWDIRKELNNAQTATKIAVFLIKSGALGQQGRANHSALQAFNEVGR